MKKDKNNINKSNKYKLCIICGILILVLIMAIKKLNVDINNNSVYDNCFTIISSSENKDLEQIVRDYATEKGYDVYFEYDGTINIINRLNQGEEFDAVWLSNSIWQYMINDNVGIEDSKYTSINPVIFAITKDKANELGFLNNTVYTKNLVDAISNNNLKFSMSNPTKTNSGASAYLGLLSTLAGNPEVLTKEILQNEELKNNLVTLFSGLERSSGSEDFLEEMFLKGNYEAVVAYESSIININTKLVAEGKEPLYAIYPVDGVSISDSPLAFINNGMNEYKKDIFSDIQAFILSDEGQKLLQEKGRRTWYGGTSDNANKNIFNPDWGIDTTKYISPIKYPSTSVIKYALNLYQSELRKPTHVVFCLDYSGSMYGNGNSQLVEAMKYILSEESANDLLQFSYKDKITIIPFSTTTLGTWHTEDGSKTEELIDNIIKLDTQGSTAIYDAVETALNELQNEDNDKYNLSIVLMTDGMGNIGDFWDLDYAYSKIDKQVPVYSIMFGYAEREQLQEIADLTNAKVFDGRTNLLEAFKEVRGYN